MGAEGPWTAPNDNELLQLGKEKPASLNFRRIHSVLFNGPFFVAKSLNFQFGTAQSLMSYKYASPLSRAGEKVSNKS